ncbi:serine hydrolase domain-containing protein [Pseudoroseicyclus sp. CXY001]|uniref:serine hydrolase domain-containing protein n=1 Tax=Pseudoroseicyclus sp. CXY001 TaxID=3242492 RepID=UPI00358DD447
MEARRASPALTPEERREVTLANWRLRPFSTWSFQHVAEVVPSAVIPGSGAAEPEVAPLGALAEIEVSHHAAGAMPLPAFLDAAESDAFVVMRRGEITAEWYAPTCDPLAPHIIFSVSKSVTGLLAGALAGAGLLDFAAPVARYIPEAEGSAFGDATVDQLIDMAVSIDFDESYLDKTGAFDRYRRATLWNPERPGAAGEDLKGFLCTIPKGDWPQGARHEYRSPDTDMAALVFEAASGRRFADLLAEYVWGPTGAQGPLHYTVDRLGAPRAAGGLSMRARDLARLGEMMRVNPPGPLQDWIAAIWAGGDRARWAAGNQKAYYKGGSYRAFWYETGQGELAGMGVHGQWLWIDRARETVIARLSTEAQPIDEALDMSVIAMLRAVAAA